MKTKGLKLEEKFILVIVFAGVLCFGLLGIFSYRQVSKIIIAQNKDDAMGMAIVAANEIDGDAFLRITSKEDREYREIYEQLSNFKLNNLITYIYAMKPEGDHLVFVIDTDTEKPAALFEPYELIDEMRPALSGATCSDGEVTSDKWGQYYSAYAPIRNSAGNVVGLVGIDVELGSLNKTLSQLSNMIIVLITLFAGVSILIYIFISSSLMNKDLLTEINNYEKLLKVGKSRFSRGQLSHYTGILINIKDFSYINQKVGSAGGDAVLKNYAQFLTAKLKQTDFVASMGGDSFFALIKNERANHFLGEIQATDIILNLNNEHVKVQVKPRCGVYPIPPKTDINDVMNCCTAALNEAKQKMDDDYKWFEDGMLEEMLHEQEVLNAFRIGLARHEFVVYYQPKVNLDTYTLHGAEALVRWFRMGKIVPPDKFIPILERNNLITDLDYYVFEQVCKDIRSWLDRKLNVVPISSNFSKLHLRNTTFAENIIKIKDKYQIESKYIDVELTESSGFYDLDALVQFVTKMNDTGIAVSIDDFGTGYSSLSLLKDLNVDIIKMDKSFFREMEKGEKQQEKMVANVIRMVQDLDREIVSEGIETQQQADFLLSIHSPIVQGYLFDRPLPKSEFEKRLLEPHYRHLEEQKMEESTEKEGPQPGGADRAAGVESTEKEEPQPGGADRAADGDAKNGAD